MAGAEQMTADMLEERLERSCREEGVEPQDVKDILINRWRIPIGKADKDGNEMHVGDIIVFNDDFKDIIMKDRNGIGSQYIDQGTFWDSFNSDFEIVGNVEDDHDLAVEVLRG